MCSRSSALTAMDLTSTRAKLASRSPWMHFRRLHRPLFSMLDIICPTNNANVQTTVSNVMFTLNQCSNDMSNYSTLLTTGTAVSEITPGYAGFLKRSQRRIFMDCRITYEGLRERTEYIDIFLFFRPSLNRVLFPMVCLLVEGECQILVF